MIKATAKTPATRAGKTAIGLVGPVGGGKTTSLAVLEQAASDAGWAVEVDLDGGESGQGNLINRIRRDMYSDRFPRKTDHRGPLERVAMTLSRGDRSVEINVIDPAGELFERSSEQDALRPVRNQVFAHMDGCSGLLILLDSLTPASKMTETWRLTIEELMAYWKRAKTSPTQGGRQPSRTAIVFTKADQIPWIARLRPREADAWLTRSKGLRKLAEDIRAMCPEVKFFFTSAVGWSRGVVNCRVAVVPRPLSLDESLQQGAIVERDLIPDPSPSFRGARTSTDGLPMRTLLPLYTDPLQVVDPAEVDRESKGGEVGVVLMPGRAISRPAQDRVFTPWNVLEPVLWAAGVDGNSKEEGEHR